MTYDSFEPKPHDISVYGSHLWSYASYFKGTTDRLIRPPRFWETHAKVIIKYLYSLPSPHYMLDLAADPSCVRDLVQRKIIEGGVAVGLYQPTLEKGVQSLQKQQELDQARNIFAIPENIAFESQLPSVTQWVKSHGRFSLVIFRPSGELPSFPHTLDFWQIFTNTILDLSQSGALILLQTRLNNQNIEYLFGRLTIKKKELDHHRHTIGFIK